MARSHKIGDFAFGDDLAGLCVTVCGLCCTFVPLPFMALGEGQITVVRAAQRFARGRRDISPIIALQAVLARMADRTQTVRAGNMLMQLENPTQSTRAAALQLDLQAREQMLWGVVGLSVTQRQEQERNLVLTQKSARRCDPCWKTHEP